MPAIEKLHRDHGNLELTLFCEAKYLPLFYEMGYLKVRSMQDFAENRWQYDVAVDMNWYVERSALRTRLDRASLFAAAFGKTLTQGKPIYRVTEEETQGAVAWLDGVQEPVVGLALVAADPRRCWIPEHSWELARKIQAAGGTPVVFHHNQDLRKFFPGGTLFADDQTLRETAALLAQCDVVVSVDSGLSHLAQAVQQQNKPHLVLLFGMWDHRLRTKWMKNFIAIVPGSDVTCAPCNEDQPYGCDNRCMNAITPEKVYDYGLKYLFGGE
jgi:ADP-heptose:LPS heptosyltransferase